MSSDIESFYRVSSWSEDLGGSGRRRFEEARGVFSRILDHVWFRDLFSGKRVLSIIDVCGGTGVGGLALASVLVERGFGARLVVNDLRRSALEKAELFGKELLGLGVEVVWDNALNIDKYVSSADIALIYGMSLPHFDPYELIYLLAVLSKILGERGVLVIEEIDRVWALYNQRDKRDVSLDHVDNRYVLSGHVSYDPLRGVFRRVFIDLSDMSRVYVDLRLWDLATPLAMAWVFFREIDFLSIKNDFHGIILARGSRGIDPYMYRDLPYRSKR